MNSRWNKFFNNNNNINDGDNDENLMLLLTGNVVSGSPNVNQFPPIN